MAGFVSPEEYKRDLERGLVKGETVSNINSVSYLKRVLAQPTPATVKGAQPTSPQPIPVRTPTVMQNAVASRQIPTYSTTFQKAPLPISQFKKPIAPLPIPQAPKSILPQPVPSTRQQAFATPQPIPSALDVRKAAVTPKLPLQSATASQKPSVGQFLGNNAIAGIGGFNKGLAQTADFILPDFLTPKPVQNVLQYYKDQSNQFAQSAQNVNQQYGTAGEIGGQLIQGTVGAIPNALLASMTAGTSLAGQGTQAAVQATPKATGLFNTIATVTKDLAKNPNFWLSFARTSGGTYEQAKAEGASELAAQATAIISGLVNAGVEVGGGIEKLPQNLKKGGQSAVRQWVESMIDEGKEEVIQGIIENATKAAVYDKNKSFVSLKDEESVINPLRAAKEFGMGAAVGGILGGGQIGAAKLINSQIQNAQPRPIPQAPTMPLASPTQPPTQQQPIPMSTQQITPVQPQNVAQTVQQLTTPQPIPQSPKPQPIPKAPQEIQRLKTEATAQVKRDLAKNLISTFNIPTGLKKAVYQDAQAISNEMADKGYVGKETKTKLLNSLIESGVIEKPSSLADVRSFIKGSKYAVPENVKAELAHSSDSYKNFRDNTMGKFTLANDGMPIDVAYKEMQDTFGTSIFPDVAHPAEMLQNILKAYDGGANIKSSLLGKSEVSGSDMSDVNNHYEGKINDILNNFAVNNSKRYADDLGRYEDFESFWFGNPDLNEEQAVKAFTDVNYTKKIAEIKQEIPEPIAEPTIDSGVRNEVDEKYIRRVSELSKRLNVSVVFEDGGKGNGRYQDGTIYINKNSNTPITDTFVHELTHHIETSKLYNDFQNLVLDSDVFHSALANEGVTVAEYKQNIRDTYAKNGIELDEDGINREMTAKFAEQYLSSEKAINRLAKQNPTIFERIKQWVNDMVVRFKGTAEEKTLLKIQQMYVKALKSVDSKNPTQDSDIRYSIKTPINETPMDKQPDDVAKVAQVLTKSTPQKIPFKYVIDDLIDVAARKITDSGNTINKIGKMSNDPTLYYMYNNAKQGRQIAESWITLQQSNVKGEKVGNSLASIFEPIRKKGDKYYKAFSEYLFHEHNIDRMAQNKPVFGNSVTAIDSRLKANELLEKHPEFAELAKPVYAYNRNLMQYRVDTGLISKEAADKFNEKYPHYVPTFRDEKSIKNKVVVGDNISVNETSSPTGSVENPGTSGKIKISETIKTATGSNANLLPLHESMSRQTMQTVQAGKRNILGLRMLNDAMQNSEKVGRYIQEILPGGKSVDIDTDLAELPELRSSFTVFDNGKPVTMKVNSGVYDGLQAISSTGREVSWIENKAKQANTMFKQLVTGYNPMFLGKNFARDIQDAGLFTKDIGKFIKNYPVAWKEMTTNGKKWRQYLSLGGYGSSFFDYEQGYDSKKLFENKNVIGKGVEKIEQLNFLVEQAPRFSEYLATVEKGGTDYENLMKAMYAAADVTVNFGRSGTWGKTLNSTFVPFFNPSVQGFDKMIRTFTQARGAKEWTGLVIKTAVLGVAASLLNALMYKDDEEYKIINDRDKDTNYLFKIRDGLWVKIPKGRVVSLFGNAAQRGLRQLQGEENAWAGFIQTAADQTAPISPFESNIYAPIEAMRTGKTWYGTDIEPQRLTGLRPGQRFDEKTDYFSKWLGGALNYSPKKINYLLDSYTGVVGDFALPLLTPRAEQNPFTKAFTIDPVTSNKLSQQFYDSLTEYQYQSNEGNAKGGLVYKYLNKQATAVSSLNAEIRRIENSNIPDADKKLEVREIKATINAIQQNALMGMKSFEKNITISSTSNSADEDTGVDYFNANRKTFGAEYALQTYDKKVHEKAVATGVDFGAFADAYFAQKDAKGDGTDNSESIAKKKAIDKATPNLKKADKEKLYTAFSVSKKVWDIDQYGGNVLSDSDKKLWENPNIKLAFKNDVKKYVEVKAKIDTTKGYDRNNDGKTDSGGLKEARYDELIKMGYTPESAKVFLSEVYKYVWR